jgi:CDP-glycerol glycerophosphotransferase
LNIIERLGFDLDGHHLVIRCAMTGPAVMTGLLVSPGGRDEVTLRFPVAECADPDFTNQSAVDLRRVVETHPPGRGKLNFFVEGTSPDGESVVRRVGRAPVSERPVRSLVTTVGEVSVRAEVGPGGNLRLAIAEELPDPRLAVQTLSFQPRGAEIEVALRVVSDHALAGASVVLSDRRTGAQARAQLAVTADAAALRAEHGILVHRVVGTVDLETATPQLPSDSEYVALGIEMVDDLGKVHRRSLPLPEDDRAVSLRPVTVTAEDRTTHYVPYVTFKGARISLKVDHFEPRAFRTLQRRLRWAWLMPLVRRFTGVWLIGELPDRAQDNGYHLFRWVRENHPQRRIYYVITADSPHRERLEALGNVLVRGSEEHVRKSLLATRLISTHLPEYLLPTPDPRLVRHSNGVRVFLQHGIMGMKNMVANYGRRSSDFHCDIFHVSSAREREMIINDFGYLPSQVRVTGLPRFDRLLVPAEDPRGILIIPTWREWLLRPEFFVESEFLERWRALLHDERIKRMLNAGERITFVLHPNLAHHTALLHVPDGVDVVPQGDRDVQDLMREHRAMITDYSSVGFDFALQGRPVYYFQFDRHRFLGKYPSPLDPVTDLPGYAAPFADDLLDEVERAWRAGFPMPEEYAGRIRRWVDHPDQQNCARAYDSVRDSDGLRGLVTRVRASDASGRLFRRFRKSRFYLPAMRALMAVARATPRSRTIVFESGNGRQYAGNPRAIYEEVVRRGTDVRTVWSSTSTFRPTDPDTRKVPPRTPRYYWELGRASHWVTDQNLGVAARPARRTFYLQTWHGTPLKRMQHDAMSQQGRKPGYLERVTRQTSYWSALLSPSPYASEKFRSAFRFTGEMLELGYPRNDVLAGAGLAERSAVTRARLGVPTDARVVLFAPTFRDNSRAGNRYVFKPGFDYRQVAESMPEDVVLLVRAHHVTGNSARVPAELRHRILDVTEYGDSQDLMAAADARITDYSSMMFDFALTGRPMLFFCPDLQEYATQLRGFYFDFAEQAPGPILRSQEELVGALHDLDEVQRTYADRLAGFVREFGPLDDGGAAARVVNELLRRG